MGSTFFPGLWSQVLSGVGVPQLDGVPPQSWDWGTPTPPPPRQYRRTSTCYAVGSTPLEVTQENFLVTPLFNMTSVLTSQENPPAWSKRHTAHCISSTPYAVLSLARGHPPWEGTWNQLKYYGMEAVPLGCEQTDTCENSTFPSY